MEHRIERGRGPEGVVPPKAPTKATSKQMDVLLELTTLKAKREVLTEILGSAKTLQSPAIKQLRAAALGTVFNAEENDPQNILKKQLNTFGKLFKYLQDEFKSDPASLAKLGKLSSEFDKIEEFYNEHDGQIPLSMAKELDAMFSPMVKLVNQSSPETYLKFVKALKSHFEQEAVAFSTIIGNLEDRINKLKQEIAKKKAAKEPAGNLRKEVEELQKQIGFLQSGKDFVDKAKTNLQNKQWANQSLPNQFVDAILNHFMPGQEDYLRYLAEMLSIGNMGAGFMNTIMDGISDFQSAQMNYDLNNWLGQGTGSASDANNHIANEGKQAGTDKGEDEAEQKKIQEQLQQVAAELAKLKKEYEEGKIPKSQYEAEKGSLDKLQGQLQDLSNQFTQSITYLDKLIAFLKDLKAVDNGKGGYTIEYSGTLPKGQTWQDVLRNREGDVVSGDPNGKPPNFGGLTTIFSEVSSNNTSWTSTSNIMQLYAQEAMTTLQMEWSMVSSGMQTLNQVYMAFAQGIYKG